VAVLGRVGGEIKKFFKFPRHADIYRFLLPLWKS